MTSSRRTKTPKKSLIDHAFITVRSGKGGDGAVSFRREKFVPKGGPDGGSGGRGGSVIIEANRSLNTLTNFLYKKHFFAENGGNGGSRNKHGKNAEDLFVQVPVGTTVIDRESSRVIKDLDKDGEVIVVVNGGRGGRGNRSFATSTDRAPRYSEKGESSEEKSIELVLKILSDVGLVGAPNAGKSTLLSAVSNAKPKIASYPFTTLSPKIGTVELSMGKSFVIADLPGLIEGASEGKGMGLEFLSHVERTKLLILLVDGADKKKIKETYKMLLEELKKYKGELLQKKRLIVINKIDLWRVLRTKELEVYFNKNGEGVFFISAINKIGLEPLIEKMYEIVKETKPAIDTKEDEVIIGVDKRLVNREVKIEVTDEHSFKVYNKELERRVELADFQKSASVNNLLKYFDKIELENLLKKAGIKEGDKVIIGNKSFIFREDG